MKHLLIVIFALSICSVNAQKPCCSATAQFADLGEQTEFRDSHQEPQSFSMGEATGEWIDFETPGKEKGRAYLVPSEEETDKYLFVFHEWWGLNEHIQSEAHEWQDRLPGVHVMAIDLYDGKIGTTRDAASELMQNADETRIKNIIKGAIDHVGKDAQVATIGWCFGGGWSMQAAIMLGDQAEACVVYYGMPEQNPEKLEQLNAPVLGIFAEKDDWINKEVVSKYESAMDEAGKKYTTYWYDANHAFANPSNAVFDKEAGEDAREKTLNFIQKHL